MLKQMHIYAVLVLAMLSTQQCWVSSDGAPGDSVVTATTTGQRYNTPGAVETPTPAQHSMQQQQQTGNGGLAGVNSHPTHIHSSSGGAGASTPGSGGAHPENRNSYNLLSEAMSQAVSNEFKVPTVKYSPILGTALSITFSNRRSLGSGSADGACQADDLECFSGTVHDRLGMEAIRTLHRQLDDDDNGNIDLSESDDFLREELKYDSGYEKRQKAFHFNDDMHISVKELWEAWLRSEVHNWTIEQTTDWLAQSVQLPQYVELFKLHKVTGAALPRLAVNNMHYVSNVLGIKDPIHKQKIALKAMDVVLFGPPRETGTRWKDYILVTLLLSAIIGCWYAYQQNKNAKRHLRRMAQDMEGLQRAEQSLQEMQKELERARMEQENVATEKMDLERRLKEAPSLTSSSSDLEVQQLKKEIEILRSELSRAEIELVDNCWAPPPQLQSWLQYTYELESKNHQKKRVSAEKQLQCAREACEKLRKKRSSLVGAFVSTHGKSIDDVDRSIVEARNALSDVTNELQERLHRWKQIENCLGFNIVNNNGLSYLESVLYGRNGGSLKGSRGRMTSSTDDLDDESMQGMLDSYSRSSASLSGGHGGSSGIISASSNTIRDDSSCSDDGNEPPPSVQFYLGNAPTTPSVGSATAPPLPARAYLQLDSAAAHMNHAGNGPVSPSTPVAVATPTIAPHSSANTALAHPPPNAHASFGLNDSNAAVADDSRHSPSVSSERSVTIPPRSKKQHTLQPNVPPPPPPPPSGPIGRAPLPPPRKSNHSQMLRSQSAELVPLEIYTYLASRPHAPLSSSIAGIGTGTGTAAAPSAVSASAKAHPNGGGVGGFGGGGSGGSIVVKKMVKQHSTTSQQSSSSTSSSVQSAPAGSVGVAGVGDGAHLGKGLSPARWSSHERVMPVHEHQPLILHQHQYQHQQQHQHQHQHQPQSQRQHATDKEPLLQSQYTAALAAAAPSVAATDAVAQRMSAALSLQSLCFKPVCSGNASDGNNTSTNSDSAAAAPSATIAAAPYGDTQLEDHLLFTTTVAADCASLDSGSLKKRKRRLRFPFSRKSSSNSNSASSTISVNSAGSGSGGKNKLT